MKFGRLINRKEPCINNRTLVNYGSVAQVNAIDLLYQRMGIKREDIINIDIFELPKYDGEYVILPINMCLWTCADNYYLPASHKVIPIFLGTHFRLPPVSQHAIDYLKEFGPIGCRDYATYMMLRDVNIPAYVNGCLSITLPRREERIRDKILLVDIPESLKSYIPESILKRAEVCPQTDVLEGTVDYERFVALADAWYANIRDEATMVITSRLHCASPCIAMGVPVIVAVDEMSSRFEWINRFIPVYTPEQYAQIDWEPKQLDIEEHKERVVQNAITRIRKAYDDHKFMCEVSEFYEECAHGIAYSVQGKIMDVLSKCGKKKYIIWGSGGFLAEALFQLISTNCPHMELTGVIDKHSHEEFHGYAPTSDYAHIIGDDSFIFVTPVSGWEEISQQLSQLGLKENEDYFGFSFVR